MFRTTNSVFLLTFLKNIFTETGNECLKLIRYSEYIYLNFSDDMKVNSVTLNSEAATFRRKMIS